MVLSINYCKSIIVDDLQLRSLHNIWKTKVSWKVQAFSWKLPRNRIPTKFHLAKPRIIQGPPNLVCPLCFNDDEDNTHVFNLQNQFESLGQGI